MRRRMRRESLQLTGFFDGLVGAGSVHDAFRQTIHDYDMLRSVGEDRRSLSRYRRRSSGRILEQIHRFGLPTGD
ncbi:MAG: hypothetical protein ACPG1Z_04420 [Planctomycetota bacterium]